MPGLVGDLGGILGPLGVTQDKAILGGVLTQPAERGRVFKTLVQAGVLRAVQVGGQAAVVLGVARRVDDGGGFFLGGGLVIALVAVILGLPLIELGLVGDAAVAALHPDGHAVGGSGFLHGQKGVAGHGLERFIHRGRGAALLGIKRVVVRHLVGVVHQHHQRVGQHGAGLLCRQAQGVVRGSRFRRNGRRSRLVFAEQAVGGGLAGRRAGSRGQGGRRRGSRDGGLAVEQERDPAHEDAGHQRQAGHPADGAVAAATARLGPGEPTAARILGR